MDQKVAGSIPACRPKIRSVFMFERTISTLRSQMRALREIAADWTGVIDAKHKASSAEFAAEIKQAISVLSAEGKRGKTCPNWKCGKCNVDW